MNESAALPDTMSSAFARKLVFQSKEEVLERQLEKLLAIAVPKLGLLQLQAPFFRNRLRYVVIGRPTMSMVNDPTAGMTKLEYRSVSFHTRYPQSVEEMRTMVTMCGAVIKEEQRLLKAAGLTMVIHGLNVTVTQLSREMQDKPDDLLYNVKLSFYDAGIDPAVATRIEEV